MLNLLKTLLGSSHPAGNHAVRRMSRLYSRWSDSTVKSDVQRLSRLYTRWSDITVKHDIQRISRGVRHW